MNKTFRFIRKVLKAWGLLYAGIFLLTACGSTTVPSPTSISPSSSPAIPDAAVRTKIIVITTTPKIIVITNTPTPTKTPTHTPTSTTSPTATPTPTPMPKFMAKSSLPLRAGPNMQYPQTGSLKKGEEYSLIGQNDDCRWLQVSDQKAINGWLRNEGNAVELQVPCTKILPGTYRPPTGLLISVQGTHGWNQIRTDNGEKLDVVFILTDLNGQLIVSAYVRNGEKFTMSKIYDGLYYLYFTTGTDWNGTIFTKNANYRRYESQFNFSTTGASEATDWYYTYGVYTINLPEKNGLISLSADQFPKPNK